MTRRATIRPFNFHQLDVEGKIMDRLCALLLVHAVERPYIFRSHDEYLDNNQTSEVMLPTRPQFPIRFICTRKNIRNEVWTRFSKAMKLKVIQVDYTLTRPNRTSRPQDLYCYFNERIGGFPEDEGTSLANLDADHAWQQHAYKYPPIHELKISQLDLEVIRKVELCIEIPHANMPIIQNSPFCFTWTWLARMESLKQVNFYASIRKHIDAADFDDWYTAWLNSSLLRDAMIDIVSRVRKSVEVRFDASTTEHLSDWTDPRLVREYFDSKIDIWNAAGGPYYPGSAEEVCWWIQHNSRFRFVFGPFWCFGVVDLKNIYDGVSSMQGILLPVEEEAAEEDEGVDNEDDGSEGEGEMGSWALSLPTDVVPTRPALTQSNAVYDNL